MIRLLVQTHLLRCMGAGLRGCCDTGTKKRALPKGARTKTFDALREKAASALQAPTK